MSANLNASPTMVTLSIALYLLSSSIFPLWWSSLSESIGRRKIFMLSFTMNVVFTVAGALSTNIVALSILRLFSGGGAASAQAVGAGTVADLWKPEERGHAMSLFYLGPLVGPLFLPLVGGALTEQFGWRSIMWFLTGWGILVLVLIALLLPETLHSRDINSTSVAVTDAPDTAHEQPPLRFYTRAFLVFRECIVDPLLSITQLRSPAIAIVILNASLAFGSSYVLNISMQSAFSKSPYSFFPTIIGLLFIPYSVGFIIASVLGGRWTDRIMIRSAMQSGRQDADGNTVCLPEDRLGVNLYISFALYPAALIAYGWTVQVGIYWVVPSITTLLFGAAVMLVFSTSTTMLTEFMPHRSSIGVALNNFVRNIFSCVGTVTAEPWVESVGHGWVMTTLGGLTCFVGLSSMWLLKRRGPEWREKMN